MEEGAMAKELLPDAFWARIAPLFVLKTGIPWEYLPAEMGCGSGMTCWRRLRDWYQAGVWRRLHQVLLEELAQADRIDWDRAALDSAAVPAPGGQETGKNPRGGGGSPRPCRGPPTTGRRRRPHRHARRPRRDRGTCASAASSPA